MKIGLILILGVAGLLLLGPVGLICGVIIGSAASIVGAQGSGNNIGNTPKPDNQLLDSAMRKIKAEAEARRAARKD